MEPDEDPFADLLALQESRKERRARAARRRRWTAIGTVIGLIVLAGVGVGVYVLLTAGSPSPATPTAASSADTTGANSTGQSAATSSTMPNLAPQKLVITAHPEVASLKITLQDGTTLSGRTPFSQQVPGGNIRVDLSKKGYNPTTRRLSLTESSGLEVWLDPAGQLVESVIQFKCGPGPQQLALLPDGRELWVALMGGGLEVYSPVTGVKTGTVALSADGTTDLVFSKDGNTVYAVNMKSGLVYEIDRVSRTVKRQLQTEGKSPKVLLLSNDGKTLWTANWDSNDLSEIDLGSGRLTRRIPTVQTPRGLYLTSDGKRLYVAGYADGELERIDLASGAGTVVFKSGGSLWDLAGDAIRGLLYFDDNEANRVFALDLNTETATELAETDNRPNTMALSQDGRVLCVANRGKDDPGNSAHDGPEWGTVLLIDTSGRIVLDAIVGGNQTTGLAVSRDGAQLAFSDFLDNVIRVYAVPPYTTLAAGKGGRSLDRFDDKIKQ